MDEVSQPKIVADIETIKKLGVVLGNKSLPMPQRFRTIFTLKNIGGKDAIDALVLALLKHEICFVLGQMRDKYSIPLLTEILKNQQENPMVRHEAGEALGAIGEKDCIAVLEQFLNDKSIEVVETCQIAIDRIKYFLSQQEENSGMSPLFYSVDPAPPYPKSVSVEELRKRYLDKSQSLFERYRALFALRDRANDRCVEILCEGLEDSSALFRHEVAYVLGQLQSGVAVLQNAVENPMVRHEAAEALGAIATNECAPILSDFLKDNQDVVKESCEVALDIHSYFNTDEFQYANALSQNSN